MAPAAADGALVQDLRYRLRTAADPVRAARAFVAAHDDRISGLSRREARKHLAGP